MLRKIYQELVTIRKELQAIQHNMKLNLKITVDDEEMFKANQKAFRCNDYGNYVSSISNGVCEAVTSAIQIKEVVWISKKRYKALICEMEMTRQGYREWSKEVDNKIYEMAKKILRQPDELSKEIQDRDDTDMMIKKFMKEAWKWDYSR